MLWYSFIFVSPFTCTAWPAKNRGYNSELAGEQQSPTSSDQFSPWWTSFLSQRSSMYLFKCCLRISSTLWLKGGWSHLTIWTLDWILIFCICMLASGPLRKYMGCWTGVVWYLDEQLCEVHSGTLTSVHCPCKGRLWLVWGFDYGHSPLWVLTPPAGSRTSSSVSSFPAEPDWPDPLASVDQHMHQPAVAPPPIA